MMSEAYRTHDDWMYSPKYGGRMPFEEEGSGSVCFLATTENSGGVEITYPCSRGTLFGFHNSRNLVAWKVLEQFQPCPIPTVRLNDLMSIEREFSELLASRHASGNNNLVVSASRARNCMEKLNKLISG